MPRFHFGNSILVSIISPFGARMRFQSATNQRTLRTECETILERSKCKANQKLYRRVDGNGKWVC